MIDPESLDLVAATLYGLSGAYGPLPLPQRIDRYRLTLRKTGGFGGNPEVYAHRYRVVADALGPGSVLDVGSGLGDLSAAVGDRPYVWLEAVPEYVEAARAKYPGRTFVLGDAVAPPCAPDSFDWAVLLTLFSYTSLEEAVEIIHAIGPCARGMVVLDNVFVDPPERDTLIQAMAHHGHVEGQFEPDAWALLYTVTKR